MAKAPAEMNLPPWARWIARDADGSWWAYEVEPLQHDNGWYENEVGRHCLVCRSAPDRNWRTTLTRCRDPG